MSVHLAMAKSAHLTDNVWRCGDCNGVCMTYPDPFPGRTVTFVICQSCERGDLIDDHTEEAAA